MRIARLKNCQFQISKLIINKILNKIRMRKEDRYLNFDNYFRYKSYD